MFKDDRQDLIRRLFALLTAKLEDGAAVAATGQDQSAMMAKMSLANRLRSTADEIACVADAIVAIIEI